MHRAVSKRIYFPILVFLLILMCIYVLLMDKQAASQQHPVYSMAVQVTQPEPARYRETIRAMGEIAAWETVAISSETGDLQMAEISAQVGDRVRAGQVLARLEDRFLRFELDRLKAQEQEAKITWQQASKNADRVRKLQVSGAIPEQQITEMLSAEQTAAQQLSAIRAQLHSQLLRVERSQIVAPDDGIILSRSLNQGQVVAIGQELFRLLRQGRLEWQARVGSADLASIKPQGKVRLDAGKAGSWDGVVRTITPDIDVKTRQAIVYVSLSAGLDEGLLPGMFAQGEFILGEHSGWSLPHSAVVMRDGQSLVFNVDASGRVQAVRVSILATLPERFVISGVDETAHIVRFGGEFLNTGDQVKIVSEGGSVQKDKAK